MGEEPFLRWVVREVAMLGAINSCVLLSPVVLRLASVALTQTCAIVCAAAAFGGLTLLNLASARYHASPGCRFYWPLFTIFEILASAAGALRLLLPR
jgi:hypothetical protein